MRTFVGRAARRKNAWVVKGLPPSSLGCACSVPFQPPDPRMSRRETELLLPLSSCNLEADRHSLGPE